jgi:S-adenosylmethionine:tRNA ribosyltransferase-isomerase
LLAEFPSEHRDEARLMVIDRKKQTIEHKTFKDVIDYFDDGDVLILNNTKVFHVCTEIKKNRAESKFFYLELNAEFLVDPARKSDWKQIVFRG